MMMMEPGKEGGGGGRKWHMRWGWEGNDGDEIRSKKERGLGYGGTCDTCGEGRRQMMVIESGQKGGGSGWK